MREIEGIIPYLADEKVRGLRKKPWEKIFRRN